MSRAPPPNRGRPMHPMVPHGRSVIQYSTHNQKKSDDIGDLLRDIELYFKHQGIFTFFCQKFCQC